MRAAVSFLLAAVLSYALLCAFLFATQRSLIYFPTPEVDLPDAEVLRLPCGDVDLRIWVVPRPGPKALVYFGGNAEDVSRNLADFAAAFPDRTLYLVNYRGYGGSTGRPTESGLRSDALAVYDHVRGRQPRVAVMGRSLGGAVAVRLASERPVEALVLATPFDSLANVARVHYRFLPVGPLLRDRYDAARRAPAVRAPALAILAAADEIVPRRLSLALVNAFRPGQARAITIAGVSHNTLQLSPDYLVAAATFLDSTRE
jgi:pimeloyl-ACP methyl ester carboxylesterase